MSSYNISYTDPLLADFSIPPGVTDGPGKPQATTTLRLFGRSVLEWGEYSNEDFVRLLESFSGSSEPHNPVGGQLWYQTVFYWHNTTAGAYAGWYVYNPNAGFKSWAPINMGLGAGVVDGPGPTVSPVPNNSYYFDGTDLYFYVSAYQQEPVGWLPRLFTAATVNPTGADIPQQDLKIYDAYGNSGLGQWVSPTVSTVSITPPPSPSLSTLWYDTATGHLNVWGGAAWQNLLGPTAGTATIASGGITMPSGAVLTIQTGSHIAITDTDTPQNNNPTWAVNEAYVNTNFLSKTLAPSQTVLSPIDVTGLITANGSITIPTAKHIVITDTDTPPLNNPTWAANEAYVGSAITANNVALGLSSLYPPPAINPAVPKDGDIKITAGPIISIYATGWRQIFPAVYS